MNKTQKAVFDAIVKWSRSFGNRGALSQTIQYELSQVLKVHVPLPSIRRTVGELRRNGLNIVSVKSGDYLGEVFYKLA